MIRQIKVSDLCNELENELIRLEYSDDSMRRYRKVFREFIDFSDDCPYSQAKGTDFLVEKFQMLGGFVTSEEHSKNEMYYFRVIRSLAEYFNFGVLFRRHDYDEEIVFPEPFKTCTEEFLKSMIEYGCSYDHNKRCKGVIKDLILFLDAARVHEPSGITLDLTSRFIQSLVGLAPVTVSKIISVLRNYYRFLYLNEYINLPLAEKLPHAAAPQRTKLPTVWSEEDIEKILKAVDFANPCGKRDYAMVLLAARLGLRVGDIKSLSLSNINWSNKEIRIVQNKTQQELILPLPDDVGWAIIDYLKQGRPITESKKVFVRHLPPFDGFTITSNLQHIMAAVVKRAGIPAENKRSYGWHTLRHSLATNLLQNNIEATTISDILGHSDPETVKHYLRVDMKDLRKCSLEVEVKNYVSE